MRPINCPFCGSDKVDFFEEKHYGHGGGPSANYVTCHKCFCRGPIISESREVEDLEAAAIKAWNNRDKKIE